MTLMYKIFNSASEGAGATVIFSDGTIQQVSQDHANYGRVVHALTSTPVDAIDEEALLALIIPALSVGKSLTRLSERVSFDGSNVLFDGDVVNDAIADHILRIIKEGGNADSYKALVAFMEKLYTNPSEQSRNSLYEFIVRHKITIDPDGDFYAYKGVKADGGSIREGFGIVDGVSMNGSLLNKPGSVLEMPRTMVLADGEIGCGIGLHAGTYEYAKGWSMGGLVLVKINPRDVVSVPDCSSFQKLRICRYKVVSHIAAKNTATTAKVEVVEDSFDALLRLNGKGEEVPVSFTYTRGNGETINVELIVTEVRTTKDDVILVGKDANGEIRNYRNTYISDLVITKDSVSAVVPKATSASVSDDVVAVCDRVANGETVVCDFNYLTLDGEARSLKNFTANGVRVAGWAGKNLLIGEREDGETRSYRTDRITDLVVHEDSADATSGSTPTLTQAQLDSATPLDLALLRSSIACGEKVTVSFDYTKVNGESRSLKNFVAEEIKNYGKELLVGTREDGETRTYRIDLIKNLVVQEEAEDEVDVASIQAAILDPAETLGNLLVNGEEVVCDFTYTKKSGEIRYVRNFKADGIRVGYRMLVVGVREDGKTRSYHLERMTDVEIHEKSDEVAVPAPRDPNTVTHLEISVDKLKTIVGKGVVIIINFEYTTVAGESRIVKNFEAEAIKGSLLVGRREDGETRSYRLDRLKKVIYHGYK